MGSDKTKRTARRARLAGGGGGAGTASPLQTANSLATAMNNSARTGLALRQLTPQEAREQVSRLTTPQLNTLLTSTEDRMQRVSDILGDVNAMISAPLPPPSTSGVTVSNPAMFRLRASKLNGQGSMIGLNRYANAINGELRSRDSYLGD